MLPKTTSGMRLLDFADAYELVVTNTLSAQTHPYCHLVSSQWSVAAKCERFRFVQTFV